MICTCQYNKQIYQIVSTWLSQLSQKVLYDFGTAESSCLLKKTTFLILDSERAKYFTFEYALIHDQSDLYRLPEGQISL